MRNPVKAVIYSDYLCPWCYVASTRLQRIKAEYGDRVEVIWQSFPLIRGEIPGRRFTARFAQSWERARREEESLQFNPWDQSRDLPRSSMPAQEAAKCAELQGEEASRRLHFLLMQAYFQEGKDISQHEVLISLTQRTQLDLERFIFDLNSGMQKEKVLHEYNVARAKEGISGIPTAIFDGQFRLESAVPMEVYRHVVDKLLLQMPGEES